MITALARELIKRLIFKSELPDSPYNTHETQNENGQNQLHQAKIFCHYNEKGKKIILVINDKQGSLSTNLFEIYLTLDSDTKEYKTMWLNGRIGLTDESGLYESENDAVVMTLKKLGAKITQELQNQSELKYGVKKHNNPESQIQRQSSFFKNQQNPNLPTQVESEFTQVKKSTFDLSITTICHPITSYPTLDDHPPQIIRAEKNAIVISTSDKNVKEKIIEIQNRYLNEDGKKYAEVRPALQL